MTLHSNHTTIFNKYRTKAKPTYITCCFYRPHQQYLYFWHTLQFLYTALLSILKISRRFFWFHGKFAIFLNPNRQCDHLYLYAQLFTVCLQMYHWLNMLFCSLMCVMQFQELASKLGSLLVPPHSGKFPWSRLGLRGPGCCPVSLTCYHHRRKRALKCLLVLSSSFPFTALSKHHSPQPDNSSRCLGGVQIAAYSLHSVRKAQS